MAEECGCDLPETLNYCGFFRPLEAKQLYSHVVFRIKRIIRETKQKECERDNEYAIKWSFD